MRVFLVMMVCLFLSGCQRVDVMIPADKKDMATLNLSIRSIKKYGQNIGRILVLSKEKLTDEAEWISENEFPFCLEDVSEKSVFRGLLSLYAPLVVKGLSKNVLTLDPRVVFCRPVSFLSRWGVPHYQEGDEAQQLMVNREVLKTALSEWRTTLESLENQGVKEYYLRKMEAGGFLYNTRQLKWMTSREICRERVFKDQKIDFVVFSLENQERGTLIFIPPEGRLTEEIKIVCQQLRESNLESEILIAGERDALKSQEAWLEKFNLSHVAVDPFLLKQNVLYLLHQLIGKYDFHDAWYIAPNMMIYRNLCRNIWKKPERLAGAPSTIMYIRDLKSLKPLIEFIDRGHSLDEYYEKFGKGWIDPYIPGVVEKQMSLVWKKNEEGLNVPWTLSGELVTGMKIPPGGADEFKSKGGLRSFSPYVTSWGFRSLAKWSYAFPEAKLDPSQIQSRDLIYVKGSALNFYMDRVHPRIKQPYVLMMLGGDEPSPTLLKMIQKDRMIIDFYCQGKNLPLGLPSDIYTTGQIEAIEEIRNTPMKREWLLSVDRRGGAVFHKFKEEKWCHMYEAVSYRDYLIQLKKSQFVLCSLNGAEDSHQIWEALYMGAIPIVRAGAPSSALAALPIVYVPSFETVTPEFLEKVYEREDLSDEEALFLPYWEKKLRKDGSVAAPF